MESEHESEHRTSRAEVEPARKCFVTARPKEDVRLGQDWCANARRIHGKTPVPLPLFYPDVLEQILSADPDLSLRDKDGNTALHVASSICTTAGLTCSGVIERLLSEGASVNTANHAGETPFTMAIGHILTGHKNYLPMFLLIHANVHSTMANGEPAFQAFLNKASSIPHWESQRYRETILFLKRGADPNTVVKREEKLLYTMLNLRSYERGALRSDFHDLFMALCKTADINTPSSRDDLPLHAALRNYCSDLGRCIEVTDAFLQRDADANQLNGRGNLFSRFSSPRMDAQEP
jgi:ankyrin repeat protein